MCVVFSVCVYTPLCEAHVLLELRLQLDQLHSEGPIGAWLAFWRDHVSANHAHSTRTPMIRDPCFKSQQPAAGDAG